MKTSKFILRLFTLIALTAINSFAQQEFTLTTTKANLVASKALIEMSGLSGNSDAIIVATPIDDTERLNPHPIGAWYYNNKWNIFNTDHATLPTGLKFKLEVHLKPDANHFLHIITRENLDDQGSYVNNPLINNNPKAQIKILQNYAPDNRPPYNLNKFEAKAFFNPNSGRWYIANVNGKDMFQSVNTAYNIVISPNNADTSSSSPPSPIATRTRMPIISTTTQPIPTSPTPQPRPLPTPSLTPAITTQPSTASSTIPCTTEMAYQTIGKWGKQRKDDAVMADRNFPKEQNKPVLAKTQKIIELFMRTNPEFKGIEATAKRIIRGDSHLLNGALPFGFDIFYGSYVCVGNDSNKVEARGKIIVSGGYGSTTIYFNSLRDVMESVQDGGAFMTTDGDEIFVYKKQLGNFKGFTMINPREEGHEAIIITPDNRLPYKPVTREQYLLARIKSYGTAELFAADVAKLKSTIANMSPAERQSPALVRDIIASPGRAKLFATEAEGGRHLVTIDKSFFNPKLPRETIQFITVHWNWYDTNIPKAEAIRQFKQNFDFEALKQMIGK